MKSIERIAEETAEELSSFTQNYHSVERHAGFDETVRVAVLAALREALSPPEAEGPVPAARLEELRSWRGDGPRGERRVAVTDHARLLVTIPADGIGTDAEVARALALGLLDLLAAHDHLERLAAFLLRDEAGTAYREGYAAGRAAGVAEALAALRRAVAAMPHGDPAGALAAYRLGQVTAELMASGGGQGGTADAGG